MTETMREAVARNYCLRVVEVLDFLTDAAIRTVRCNWPRFLNSAPGRSSDFPGCATSQKAIDAAAREVG